MSDSPNKKGSSGPSVLLIAVTAVVLIIACVVVGRSDDQNRKDEGETITRVEASASVAVQTQQTARPATIAFEPYVRKRLVAPARSYEGATWFDVPSGYHPMICEADENLACTSTETDISAVGFELQCKDLSGNIRDWHAQADLIGCHARAKGDTPLTLAAWLEPL